MPAIKPEMMHPLLVHVPIVLLGALALSDHIALFAGRNLCGRSCLPSLSALLAVVVAFYGTGTGLVHVHGVNVATPGT